MTVEQLRKYVPTPNVTVTIRGYDRRCIAEVIRQESRRLREDVMSTKRRAETPGGKRLIEFADRLWNLAQEIEP